MALANQRPKTHSIINLQLFVSGHSNDPSCIHLELPKDIIQVICTIFPIEFVYESMFDQKGVLAWIRNLTASVKLTDKSKVIFFKWNNNSSYFV
jgi:hypothetical protein